MMVFFHRPRGLERPSGPPPGNLRTPAMFSRRQPKLTGTPRPAGRGVLFLKFLGSAPTTHTGLSLPDRRCSRLPTMPLLELAGFLLLMLAASPH